MNENLMDEVGKILSVLAKRESGLCSKNFLQAYKKETGQQFPLRKLGHVHPLKAVEAMDAYVKIENNSLTGEKHIVAVKTATYTRDCDNIAVMNGVNYRTPQSPHIPDTKHAQRDNGLRRETCNRIQPPPNTMNPLPRFPHHAVPPTSFSVPPPSIRHHGNTTSAEKVKIHPENLPVSKESGTDNFAVTTVDIAREKRVPKKAKSKSVMIPVRGTYQLTFINRYQMEKSEIIDIFQKFGKLISVSVLSGIKRRCFVHYSCEEEALVALDKLKDDDQFHELDIADDCKRIPTENENDDNVETDEEEEEAPDVDIRPHRGTYQLSFSTEKYVRMEDINIMFSEFGPVAGIDCNFKRVKGRARVFVKFHEKIHAVTAFKQLKDSFEDLEVAKSCVGTDEDETDEVVPEGPDGLYCIRFRNLGPGDGLFNSLARSLA
jgi:hypothetical protein